MIGSWLILGGVIAIVGVLLVLATVLAMALHLLRPPRMTDGKAAYVLRRISPGDLGMQFEEMRLTVRDEARQNAATLQMATWWLPHPAGSDRCAVLIHGYADGKVGAIAWAPMWQSLGYNIVAVDLRAHGYSGGRHMSAGFFERHDVSQVLDQLLAEHPARMRQIVLFGVSLGAAVALGVTEMRDDIDAIVLECPYADFRNAVAAHAQIMLAPLPSLTAAAISLAERISGANFNAVRPVDLLDRTPVPALVIAAEDDPFVPHGDTEAIQDAMRRRSERGVPSEFWRVDHVTHVMGIVADPEAYRTKIGTFLQSADVPTSPTPHPSGS